MISFVSIKLSETQKNFPGERISEGQKEGREEI
jgi:hypothetical protein